MLPKIIKKVIGKLQDKMATFESSLQLNAMKKKQYMYIKHLHFPTKLVKLDAALERFNLEFDILLLVYIDLSYEGDS